jgi:hypothetical protein
MAIKSLFAVVDKMRQLNVKVWHIFLVSPSDTVTRARPHEPVAWSMVVVTMLVVLCVVGVNDDFRGTRHIPRATTMGRTSTQ